VTKLGVVVFDENHDEAHNFGLACCEALYADFEKSTAQELARLEMQQKAVS
jgi:hypothetical protein